MDQADPVIGIAPVISYERVIVDQIDHEGCSGGEVDDPAGSDLDPHEQFKDDHAEAQRNDAVFKIGADVGGLMECVGGAGRKIAVDVAISAAASDTAPNLLNLMISTV